MRLDGTLGEHIRLAFQVLILIQLFQRAEKIIGAVIGKGQSIGTGIDKSVFCGKTVIEGVQLRLRFTNSLIGDKAVHLLTDQLLYTVSELYHAFGAFLGSCVQIGLCHDAVLPIVNLTVHDGIGEILYIRVGGNGLHQCFVFAQVGSSASV